MPPVVKVGDSERLLATEEYKHARWPFVQFNCFTRETRFITDQGIKSFEDFKDGDKVKVLTKNGGYKTATIRNYGMDNILEILISKLGSKRQKRVRATANHIWFIKNKRKVISLNNGEKKRVRLIEKPTVDLKPGDKLHQKFRYQNRGFNLCSVGIMHGLVFGDGTYSKHYGDCRIHLCADSRQFANYFTTGTCLEYEKGNQTIIWGLPSDWKQLPKQTNEEYLAGFLAGWIAADAKVGGNVTLCNKDKTNLDFVHNYIAPKLGLDVSEVFVDREPHNNGTYPTKNHLYGIRFYQHTFKENLLLKKSHKEKYSKATYETFWYVESVAVTQSEESVWCVEEPVTNSFVLEDGIVTHNCVQSRVFDYYDKDNNLIIATSTSSGKTVCGEMLLAHEIRKRGGKGLYLVPLRALAQEKIDDWTSKEHHFGDLKISICTGDYRLTAERKAELDAADLIIMSYEMFNSRVRNLGSERSEFLTKVKTLVADEVHLLTVPNRGDHLEAGLMKFTEINKDCRLVFLSATMPNVEEIANWVSFILNNKETVLLKSTFRPCPLNLHYEKYWDGERTYDENEQQKVNMALQIVDYYPEDKFLIFAHTKKTGELMKQALRSVGVKCEFHNADLDKSTRTKVEKAFKSEKDLRVIVATSTLAWGLNLPARRVIILGVHRGLDEVATYDIWQMVGRSGRPGYDPCGDAYILLPERTYEGHKMRIKTPQLILSQMLDQEGGHHKVLAFHLVSEINQETIKTKEDVHHWYERSLAAFQSNELDDIVVDNVMDLLKKCGAVWEEDGVYTVTSVGKIASLFYYSPFDISDLKKNFGQLFDERREDDDLALSVSLANLDTHRFGIVSKAEREEMGMFANEVMIRYGRGTLRESVIKVAYAYSQLLNGVGNPIFASLSRNLQFDFPRLNQVLQAIDSFGGKWNKNQWFRELQLRMNYGVKGPMLQLCQLPHIGKVRATKLWNAGIRTSLDIINNIESVRSITKLKKDKIEEIIAEAKKSFAISG